MTATTGYTLRLLKVIADDESQVLSILQDQDLPLRETQIDRFARPIERWNVRPSIDERTELEDERTELEEALRDRRAEIEAEVDRELRQLRSEKLAAAGL